MIDIVHTDGATIITIQNPTPSEQRLIEKAESTKNMASSDVWAKFKCNKNSQKPVEAKTNAAPKASNTVETAINSLRNEEDKFLKSIGFEDIWAGDEDLPF